MSRKLLSNFGVACFLLLLLNCLSVCADTIPLNQIEKTALAQSPELNALRAKSMALSEAAIAAGQWVDPKLKFGTINIPVDTFDFSQAPMTQIQVGLGLRLRRELIQIAYLIGVNRLIYCRCTDYKSASRVTY